MSGDDRRDEVLRFWFGDYESDEQVLAERQSMWFRKDAATDAEIRRRFGDLVEAAVAGGLAEWTETPRGALALILVLDQLARNIHRDDPRAYAGDARALALSDALYRGEGWAQLRPLERAFALMPTMHAEDADVQRRGAEAFYALAAEAPAGAVGDAMSSFARYADMHRDIVVRFGRFPHRNRVLGRETSAEEAEFLTQPNSSF